MKYKFGGLLPLEPLRLMRLDKEKEQELRGCYDHHTLPESMRGMNDCAVFRSTVEVPRNDEQVCKAFERAMNACLDRLPSAFYHEMNKLSEEPQ